MSSAQELGVQSRLSYVLPIRVETTAATELTDYLCWLASRVEVIVVDGSPAAVFAEHRRKLLAAIIHIRPDSDLRDLLNQKVAGVITGGRRASHPRVIIADDDVRYDEDGLQAMADALDRVDVVRPQNYFAPLPWHAYLDTARTLINRVTGGDWPGTLGVRWPVLRATGGYDGNVLFENLELVRTVIAAGGVEECATGLYVRRLPPSTRHFWSQRVRQAYDELARPARLAIWLSIAPITALLIAAGRWPLVVAGGAVAILAAEAGRRRAGARRVFPAAASLLAPLWIGERAICAWLAVGAYLLWGGVPYRKRVISRAATPVRQLRQRLTAG
jgi:hypothetical protein